MAYFTVTYDLNKAKDYAELYKAFDAIGAHKALRSVYLVDYQTDADGLLTYLRRHIDEDDWLMVVEFSEKPAKYKCLQGTQNWLDARF